MADDREVLRAVRDELVALGATDGMDFAVLGTGEPSGFSSELIVLRRDDDGWHVDYRDMGTSRELLCTADLEGARERFVNEVLDLASGRGRGPRAVPRAASIPLSELRRRAGGA